MKILSGGSNSPEIDTEMETKQMLLETKLVSEIKGLVDVSKKHLCSGILQSAEPQTSGFHL